MDLRVAIYNQMFGINGRSLVSNLYGHWAVHFQENPRRIYGRVNLESTVRIINESGADIVGICEVLEGQEAGLRDLLGNRGYNYLCFGDGHRTRHSNLVVKAALASKLEFEDRTLEATEKIGVEFPVENHIGGGGGFVYGYFPGLYLNTLVVHFASPKTKKLHKSCF